MNEALKGAAGRRAPRVNPIRRWRLKNQLRVAARLNAAGDLTDAYYGSLVTHIVFELGGQVLKDGDTFSPVDFELAAHRAFGKGVAYALDPALERDFGQYGRAPTYLRNATSDYTWGAQAQGLYEATLPLVSPLPRFEARIAKLRKDYPALTGAGGWLVALIVGGIVGALITRLVTCP